MNPVSQHLFGLFSLLFRFISSTLLLLTACGSHVANANVNVYSDNNSSTGR